MIMESGVYYIRNKIDGKTYIGQGQDVKERMFRYHANCNVLLNALNKYGEDNFEREVIEYCSIEELDDLESYYIEKWNTLIPNGYNISPGGKAPMRGRKHSEESKKRMSSIKVGKLKSEETKKRMSGENNANYGKDFTGENNPRFGDKLDSATSKYYGVYLLKRGKYDDYWMAQICINGDGKKHYIGHYSSEIEAAKAYDQYVIEHKLNRPLNFPK
jgi:group I intron endonuclease